MGIISICQLKNDYFYLKYEGGDNLWFSVVLEEDKNEQWPEMS